MTHNTGLTKQDYEMILESLEFTREGLYSRVQPYLAYEDQQKRRRRADSLINRVRLAAQLIADGPQWLRPPNYPESWRADIEGGTYVIYPGSGTYWWPDGYPEIGGMEGDKRDIGILLWGHRNMGSAKAAVARHWREQQRKSLRR